MNLIGPVIAGQAQRLILIGEQPRLMRPEKLLPVQQTVWLVLKDMIIRSLMLRMS